MKSFFLILCLFGLKYSATAQQQFTIDEDKASYAIVKDTDGFVNIRKSPDKDAPIIGKISNYNVFTCEPTKTNWWKVIYVQHDSFTKSSWLEGYIYNNRVSLLTGWKVIKRKNSSKDVGVFKKDSISITVNRVTFKPTYHKLLYKEKELFSIDGKTFWGTDGEIPNKRISSVKIITNKECLFLPKNSFNDLYQPNFNSISICNGPDNTFYISMLNSDGAGAYYIVWVIKNNKYYSRYIDDSLD